MDSESSSVVYSIASCISGLITRISSSVMQIVITKNMTEEEFAKKYIGCGSEKQFLTAKVAKIIESPGDVYEVFFDKPIKLRSRHIDHWYFFNIKIYDIRIGDILRYEITEDGLHFRGIDLEARNNE